MKKVVKLLILVAAVMATVGAQNGMSLDEILDELKEVGTTPKF